MFIAQKRLSLMGCEMSESFFFQWTFHVSVKCDFSLILPLGTIHRNVVKLKPRKVLYMSLLNQNRK